MLAHPTLDQLHTLGLHGLAKGFRELEHKPEARSLDHAEWLGLLLEYELTLRRQKQFETRARGSRLISSQRSSSTISTRRQAVSHASSTIEARGAQRLSRHAASS